MWTTVANRGYTVVTLHRIDPGWHLRSVILGFKRMEYPHSGPRLADHLLEVVTSMDSALLRSTWAITTDNASKNNAMNTWEIVQSAIKLRKPIEELLRRIRDRHDGYTDFSIAPGSRLASCIPADTWSTLEAFCQFLAPVKAATTMMSGKNYPTFGMAVVVFELISRHAKMAVTQATSRYTKTNCDRFCEENGRVCRDCENPRSEDCCRAWPPNQIATAKGCRRYELHVFVRIRSYIPADI
ncbi:hypothetical protein JG688_00015163 [Phytophthora aleatoria]|uniref:DUF659 domain-containing protein n=1 Tax=Phytophthora aleatoria TaxID=2496075 RepID=A0A8J5IEQ4_9STRA|nr:hypothetical protein JG688_00015163 [Phytophthora aleatoria]